MPHLKFFQEHCSLLIDQQRGQCLQRPVVMAHAQKHNLECLDGVALIRICNFCF